MKKVAVVVCLIALLGLPRSIVAAGDDDTGLIKRPSAKALERAERLKSAIQSFRLHLTYRGSVANHYQNVNIIQGDSKAESASRFDTWVMEPQPQLIKIIDYLAGEGFLDRAEEVTEARPKVGPENRYTLTVSMDSGPGQQYRLHDDMGWGRQLLPRIEALRALTTGGAVRVMGDMLEVLRKEFVAPLPAGPGT